MFTRNSPRATINDGMLVLFDPAANAGQMQTVELTAVRDGRFSVEGKDGGVDLCLTPQSGGGSRVLFVYAQRAAADRMMVTINRALSNSYTPSSGSGVRPVHLAGLILLAGGVGVGLMVLNTALTPAAAACPAAALIEKLSNQSAVASQQLSPRQPTPQELAEMVARSLALPVGERAPPSAQPPRPGTPTGPGGVGTDADALFAQ